jgi:signal peptidase
MSPEFEAGSYIIVKEKPTEEIGVGDVISYYVSDGKTVLTHRVVERTGEGGSLSFITRGDANNTNDENPVAPGQVLGTVVLPVNGLGTFLLTLRNPRSLALYAFIILAIFIGPELYRRITRRRRDEGSAAGNARFERSDAARIDAVKDVVSLGREGSPY